MEKPIAPPPVIAPAPVPAPPPPQPRYVKPDGFDAASAWQRIATHEDVIPNVVGGSPFVLSRDEQRIAFVTRERGAHRLFVRSLYDPGPDYSLAVAGEVSALAWSPDDRRIIFLSADSGTFSVCEPSNGRIVPLPIPALDPSQRHNLLWWRKEDIVVYRHRGEPAILSLDTLRMTTAKDVPDWGKLSEDERARLGREAFVPAIGRTEKARFSLIGGFQNEARTLTLNDDDSLYSRFAANVGDSVTAAFPNRDGTMFFVVEPQRLRILQFGLREAPPLRFVAEGPETFPANANASVALAKKAVRAAVAAPIVNPLNGKTVAGDPAQIKGYARIITATGKVCSVWIEQERQSIREGDVLIALSSISENEEFSLAPEWWAILSKPDENQSIPHRADAPALTPSMTRVLKPLPETVSPKAAPPPSSQDVAATSPKSTPSVPAPDKSPAPSPAPFFLKESFPEEGQLRKFIADHYAKLGKNDLAGATGDYAIAVDFGPGKTLSREDVAEAMRQLHADWDTITETAVEPLELKRLGGNRFSISYTSRVELKSASKPTRLVESALQLEVILTGQGPKIVKQNSMPLFAADPAAPSPPPKSPAIKVEEKPTQEDQIRAFLIAYHKQRNDRDLDGIISSHAAVSRTNGVVMTHASIRAWETKSYASGPRILEKVVSRINLERGPGNQFAAKYEVAFEKQNPKADDVRSIANVETEVLLTQDGPKIISEEVRVHRREPIRNR